MQAVLLGTAHHAEDHRFHVGNCPPYWRPQVSWWELPTLLKTQRFLLGTAHLTEDQSLLLLGTAHLTEDPRILLLFRNWPTLPGEAEYVLAEDPAGEEDGETVAVQLVPDHHVVIHKTGYPTVSDKFLFFCCPTGFTGKPTIINWTKNWNFLSKKKSVKLI